MDAPSKLWLRVHMVFSFLGLFMGLSAFLVFVFVFGNYQAGLWAFFSGIFATLCMHLHLLQYVGNLEQWYTARIMRSITMFAAVFLAISTSFMIWYIYRAAVNHFDFYPIESSDAPRGVMSFLSVKWTLSLTLVSVYYRRLINGQMNYRALDNEPDQEPLDISI